MSKGDFSKSKESIVPLRGVVRDGVIAAILDQDGNEIGAPVTATKNLTGRIRNSTPTGEQYEVAAGVNRLAMSGHKFRGRMYRGRYGKRIASWSALQNQAGTYALVTGDLPPFADNETKVLQLTQNATASFGQQNPIDGGQAYMPSSSSAYGFWVKNSGARSLAFELRMYNAAASHSLYAYGMVEPTGAWQFMTISPSQMSSQSWAYGTDAISYVRLSQRDSAEQGAWQTGESLKFGNVYCDTASRPRFILCFDDAVSSTITPKPTAIVSGSAYVSSTASNVLTTAAAHGLMVGWPIKFTDTAPTSLSLNTTYYVATVPSSTTFTLATDQFTLASVAATTGFSGTANWVYAGSHARCTKQVVEEYGFKATTFVIGAAIGTSGVYGNPATSFMTAAEILALYADGWAVGSHSYSHPANNENAGLRLLGPYGYYLSNTVDNLPAAYVSAWGLGAANRRRVTAGTQANPSVFTTENPHKFLTNQPIVFTDVAPTGCALGVTYYVATVPSSTTFTLATDQGSLSSTVANTTGAWSGTANYRYPGSAIDDSAIYADIIAGINAVSAIGIPTAAKYFALPQGGADQFVRSAVIRSGVTWVRGIGNTAHTIAVGQPTGGASLAGIIDAPGGWLSQIDAVQTDSASLTWTSIKTYVDECKAQGAIGANYHHDWISSAAGNLDQLCAYLRTLVAADQIDVVTADDLAAAFNF